MVSRHQLYEVIETAEHIYLVMEYASGGELFDYIVRKGRLAEGEACDLFHQLIDGIHYLHQIGVVHRSVRLTVDLPEERTSLMHHIAGT